MKILVTGSNGFIGHKLIKKLLQDGHSIIGLDLNSNSDRNQFDPAQFEFRQLNLNHDPLPDLAQLHIDLVFHLAISMRPRRDQSTEELLLGTNRLLNAVSKAETPYFIGMSSLSVLDFDLAPEMSLIDESVKRCDEVEKMGRYAALKSKQEEMLLNFAESSQSTKMIIARPGLVYERPEISDAYAGIIKSKVALLIENQGQIPLVALESLLQGLSDIVKNIERLSPSTVFHFVDDNLPSSRDYLAYLKKRGYFPRLSINLNWVFMQLLVTSIYKAISLFNLQAYLPDLLKPQSFSTRLKPFKYSNTLAKNVLDWKPLNSDL